MIGVRNGMLSYNLEKTKIMHFRSTGKQRINSTFKLGRQSVEFVSEYKYLGLVFDEFLNFLPGTNYPKHFWWQSLISHNSEM